MTEVRIGQSFADPLPRIGRLDVYPEEGTFTTTAQAGSGCVGGVLRLVYVSRETTQRCLCGLLLQALRGAAHYLVN